MIVFKKIIDKNHKNKIQRLETIIKNQSTTIERYMQENTSLKQAMNTMELNYNNKLHKMHSIIKSREREILSLRGVAEKYYQLLANLAHINHT